MTPVTKTGKKMGRPRKNPVVDVPIITEQPIDQPVVEIVPAAVPKKAVVSVHEWTRLDPVITNGQRKARTIWVAVFKCQDGHKTKATNRQGDEGITCYGCGKHASMMEQFKFPPAPLRKDVDEDDK